MAVSALALQGCALTQTTGKDPLGDAIEAYELTQDGRKLAVQRGGLTEVDINSSILLEVKRDKLMLHAQPFGARQGDIEHALDEMARILGLLKKQAGVVAAIEDALKPAGKMGQAALDDARRLSNETRQEADLLARDSGDPLPSGSAGPSAYLIDKARRSATLAETLISDERVRLRVGARVGSNIVHVPSYDNQSAGAPVFLPPVRRSSPPPPIDKERKEEGAEQPGRSEDRSVDAQERAKELRDRALALEQATLARRRAAMEALRAHNDAITSVVTASANVVALIESPANEHAALKGAAGKAVEACGDALLEKIPAAPAPAPDDDTLTQQLQKCGKALGPLTEAQTLYKAKDPAKLTKLDNAVTALGTALAANLLLPLAWAELALAQHTPRLAPTTAEATVAPAKQDRPAARPLSTTIDLLRVEREEGDIMSYQPSLVVDGQVMLEGAPVSMMVVRNGPQLRVAPAAFFVQPFKLTEGEPAFRPLPSVVASVHYRFGRCAVWHCDESAVAARPWPFLRALNFLDPGVGLHMMTLGLGTVTSKTDAAGKTVDTTTSNAFELGVGGTFQLFGDVLQISAGYDLQAQRTYWAFGVGLQTLTDFGINWPPVERSSSGGN
ncbi:hypothetical protein BE04_30085 [Sorangium cellulosum]|uniref:Uncharacterized protein n=1 Tax=Sorangium cellulosum TaxID=56 RepID=A0A150Q630_SORCE|nr:hypothetical protein BE04_30085 [Sorangium cellulosum]